MRMNCWEYTKCGRELGGRKTKKLGICPVSTECKINGVNNGRNGGRTCWVITGTLCDSKVQGNFQAKLTTCLKCDFYRKVSEEEGKNFVFPDQVLRKFYAPKKRARK